MALLGAIERIAPLPLTGAVLLLAAGFVGDWLRWVLWLGAIAIGLFGPLFTGLEGWPLHIAHFVERHGLASQVVCRTWCAGTNDQTPKGATWVPKLVM